MAWVYYFLLLVVAVFGLLLNIVGLPGLWLIVAAYGGYAWLTGWDNFVGWPSLITIIVLALVAEIVEFIAGAAGSKAAGATTRGMIGAIVGGFLGAIFLSIIPIPIVAQIFGACAGAFLGALLMQLTNKNLEDSIRIGAGAAKGRFLGIVSKLCFGIVMMGVAAVAAIPIGGQRATRANNVPPAAMIPSASTVPTTQLGATAATSLEPLIIGKWVSPDSVVDTYSVDGTVVTVGTTTLTRNWRVGDDAVEIGTFNKAGNFVRDGEPRHIGRDAAGNVVSVGESKRVTTGPSTPSQAP